MIKVLIVEDHVIMRDLLRRVISDEGDMIVVGEASNGTECIDLLRNNACDVVLLDISMPKRGGVETLQHIRRIWPKLAVLVLSMYPEEQYAVRMIRTGASGYLTKETEYEQLVYAIRKVATGARYISPKVAEILAESLTESLETPHQSLSNRELQILLKIAAGKSVSDIAQELSLSVKTVSTYKTRVLEKMRMENTAELVRYAVKHELLLT